MVVVAWAAGIVVGWTWANKDYSGLVKESRRRSQELNALKVACAFAFRGAQKADEQEKRS